MKSQEKSCNLGRPFSRPITHTHKRFTALWILSGTTRVSRYQKKHSPTTLIVVINHFTGHSVIS